MRHRARKVELDGIVFDSGHEADRYRELVLLERCGEISQLTVHTKFLLKVEGVLVGTYTCDFTYLDAVKVQHIEDVKGWKKSKKTGMLLPIVNREFGLKCKLMKALFGLEVEVV